MAKVAFNQPDSYVVRPSRVDEDHLVIQGSGRSSGVGVQVAS